ncbi:MAG: C4-dicarboxylate ABC transporter permease, partial [Gemmatimonadetes bacterium]|nr:C4-dicarboxylate ABC transporter permease [Gemmatimonadota bacterium]
MDGSVVALLGIALLLALILMRVSVGLSMLIAGAAGIALIRPQAVLAVIA